MRQSYQTKSQSGFFQYNPFTGADILLFPTDRPVEYPRVFVLEPYHKRDTSGEKPRSIACATACNGRVHVSCDPDTRQITCTVNGKQTERFSIRYAPTRNRRKKAFASY